MRCGRNRLGMVSGAPECKGGIGPDLHGDRWPRRGRRRCDERYVAECRHRGSGIPASGTWRSARPVRQVSRRSAADAFVDADDGRYGSGFSVRRCRNRRGRVFGDHDGKAGSCLNLHGGSSRRRVRLHLGLRDETDCRHGGFRLATGAWRTARAIRRAFWRGPVAANVGAHRERDGNGFPIRRCRNRRGGVPGDHDGKVGSGPHLHGGLSRRRDRFHRVMRDVVDDRHEGFRLDAVGAWRSARPVQRAFRRGLVLAVDGADSERDGSGYSIWRGRDCRPRREAPGYARAPRSAADSFAARTGETSRDAAG